MFKKLTFITLVFIAALTVRVLAVNPPGPGGTGSGAISTDGNGNVTMSGALTVASTTNVSARGIRFSDQTVQTTAATGGGATSTSAGLVTPGAFNSVAGTGGNYSFPASLSIATTTAPSGGVLFVNGNVGIGTTAPGVALHVKSSGEILRLETTDTLTTSGTNYLIFKDAVTDRAYVGFGGNPSEVDFHNYISGGNMVISTVGSGNITLTPGTTGNVGIGTTAPAQRLSVVGTSTFSGNVGIGTSTPSSKLDIYGVGGAPNLSANSGLVNLDFSALTSQLSVGAYDSGAFALWLQGKYTTNAGTNLPIVLNPLGGNVGVGNSAPSQTFEVSGNTSSTQFCLSGSCIASWSAGSGGWTDGGTNVYLTTATDNVGIGTTTPAGLLHVVGSSSAFNSLLLTNTSVGTGLKNWGIGISGNNLNFMSEDDNGTGGYIWLSVHKSGGGGAQMDTISFPHGAKIGIATTTPSGVFTIASSTTGTSLFTVTPGGWVGIGLETPLNPLAIAFSDAVTTPSGSTALVSYTNKNTTNGNTALFSFRGTDTNGATASMAKIGAQINSHTPGAISGDLVFLAGSNDAPAEWMRITATGNVGIGTTTPAGPLEIAAGADEMLRFSRATATYPTIFSLGTDSGLVIKNDNLDTLSVNNGWVGIATSSPIVPLTVVGHIGSYKGATPPPGASACGSSIFTPSGTDTAGTMSVGTGTVTSCTITFGTKFKRAPICVASLYSTSTLGFALTTVSTSTLVVSASTTFNGKRFSWICFEGSEDNNEI